MIILLEGPDGAGKTTLAKALAEKIAATIFPTPSDTVLGKLIRSIQDSAPLNDPAMAHLYIADQLDTESRLRQAIQAGQHIVLDRHCMTSGPAYRPDAWGALWQTMRLSRQFAKPDLGVLVETSVETMKTRLIAADHPIKYSDRGFEQILNRTRGYLDRFSSRMMIVDGAVDPQHNIKLILSTAASL